MVHDYRTGKENAIVVKKAAKGSAVLFDVSTPAPLFLRGIDRSIQEGQQTRNWDALVKEERSDGRIMKEVCGQASWRVL